MKQTIIVKQMVIWVALLVCVLSAPNSAWAQTPTDGPTVNDVAEELYCPLCSGLTVDVCELQVCYDMREVITDKLAAGDSPEQIQAYFVEQYGQKVVGKPSTEGFHLTAWLMPFIVLFAAALILFFWLRNQNPSAGSVPFASTSVAPQVLVVPVDEYNLRLEQELRNGD